MSDTPVIMLGPAERANSERRDHSHSGQSQSSPQRDRSQAGLPLRPVKTLTWADVARLSVDAQALMDGAIRQEHRDLVGHGLGGGPAAGEHRCGTRPCSGGRRDVGAGGTGCGGGSQLPLEEESSSGASSVYYSFGGSDCGDEEESEPVSSRTRSRHGGLLAVLDAAGPSVDASVACWVASARQHGLSHTEAGLHTGEVREDFRALWSVKGFLNVESPVDIGLFDHSCQQMDALLRKRMPHSDLQRMTFHTTSLAAKRE